MEPGESQRLHSSGKSQNARRLIQPWLLLKERLQLTALPLLLPQLLLPSKRVLMFQKPSPNPRTMT
jgi:hypothetical protein